AWPSSVARPYSSRLRSPTECHGPQAARPSVLARHPPAAGPAGVARTGGAQPRHRRRPGQPRRRHAPARAAARGPGHPRPPPRLPGRGRHPRAAGRGSPGHGAGGRLPAGMSLPASLLPPPEAVVLEDVRRALAEDIGDGDATAALLPDQPDSACLLCKEDAVVAGRPWFDATHRALDPQVRIEWRVAEGQRVAAGTVLAVLYGRTRALVSAERTSLNFMQTLSGTATVSAGYVEAVRGTGTTILDTRKTLPGLRQAQKYAVRAGGGG